MKISLSYSNFSKSPWGMIPWWVNFPGVAYPGNSISPLISGMSVALCTIMVPFSASLYILLANGGLFGFFNGCFHTCGNVLLLTVWKGGWNWNLACVGSIKVWKKSKQISWNWPCAKITDFVVLYFRTQELVSVLCPAFLLRCRGSHRSHSGQAFPQR